MAKIFYTEDFKGKVRELYGNSLNAYLEQGLPSLKQVLESYPTSLTAEQVLTAKTLKELKIQAKKVKDNVALIDEWWKQPGV